MRLALGVGYRGAAYHGWQVQTGLPTLQAAVEQALGRFADQPVRTVCAGRTDAAVHAVCQVVHLDTGIDRPDFSWVRGSNRYLPPDVALLWCRRVSDDFHARNSALGRRYRYLVLESEARPALEAGLVGWSFRRLDGEAMREAAALLIGRHDFSAFRAAECQSPTPVKTLRELQISRRGAYWRFDFEADAFLQHMVRNLMGTLLRIGSGLAPPNWAAELLAARDRARAAPTFAPDGLYFVGPYYDPRHGLPNRVPATDWLP